IERWYLAVYADAVEWVEMPNTLGMAVFADGGKVASKPYASSGAYINRMSNFCKSCSYDVKKKIGTTACPFNYLYWAFLIKNQSNLDKNPRMGMPYRTLAKWSAEKKASYVNEAGKFLASLNSGQSS
ncbi:MAG: cryptochrome/photolyase family protein, partial [Rhodospirillaceae bacterium]|nr:cryptochrome/photolyase family protein [Rhodospirillaceae bacterium]